MEDSAIIVAIIAAVASVFGAVFTFFSSRYNSKTNKTTNILEEQYLKVISPIHQILHMTPFEDIYDELFVVIKDNYHLLPNQLFDDFVESTKVIKEATNTNDLISSPFGERVEEFYKILRYKLHYSTIKVSKEEKESERLLALPKKRKGLKVFSLILMWLSALVGSCLFGFWYLPEQFDVGKLLFFYGVVVSNMISTSIYMSLDQN